MAGLRIFSYLPNPRVWKATIAARFCGVDIEIRGASGKELRDWLWDYALAEQERQSLSSLVRTGRVGLTGAKLFKTDVVTSVTARKHSLECRSLGYSTRANERTASRPYTGLRKRCAPKSRNELPTR